MYRLITTVRNVPMGWAAKVYRDADIPEAAGQWLVCCGDPQTDNNAWTGYTKDEAVKAARIKVGHPS